MAHLSCKAALAAALLLIVGPVAFGQDIPVPVVYVNGRAKANPAPEEVVAEYRRGRAG